MSYHTIEHQGTVYAGPSEYEREDQEAALALFMDMYDASALYPNNPVAVVEYIRSKMPMPTSDNAAYAEIELIRHLTTLVRQFKSAWAARARDERGPQLPPHQVDKPEPLPEKLVPGQRVNMVDPETGEIKEVIVPPQSTVDDEPKVNPTAVQLNAARSHCYEQLSSLARRLESLAQVKDSDLVAEAMRKVKECDDTIKSLNRQSKQIRGYYDVLELVAAAHPRYPEAATVEDIVQAEAIDLRAHGLSRKKLREFLAVFSSTAQAAA
ncbi:hypothetical protein GCM10010300_77540 [Streptomyces olivaceoviridis]|uniref:hypothetical protein n=1 Tax=Streptomyces olivaceoviridis TaxID=1921 RepID=UPI001677155E|nr:hypothetical protein [Streptomyces olivaceoviridis]GGZ22295.1 hypothetical protein GCM10010300_77540 [Streptomyces olivaceoviridis]